MIKMIAYVRVSTDKQAEEGVSLDAQVYQIKQYASLYDIEITDIIRDDGYSAKSLERPGLIRVFNLLNTGSAEGVIITKLDRLTRSVFDLGYLLKNYMEKYRFCSVYDKFDTDTASGRMILSILTTVSQWEREVISERTKSALLHKKTNGERIGNIPYGKKLSSDGIHLEVNEEESKIISDIKDMRRRGLSYTKIRNVLTYSCRINRQGKPFSIPSIHRIYKM